MKIFNNIFSLILCSLALFFSSCIKEEVDLSSADEQVTLKIDIVGGSAVSRAGNLSTLKDSYKIKSLRIFVVDHNGEIESNEYVGDLDLTESSDLYHSFEVVKEPKKILYVLLNEPSSLSSKLDEVQWQYELTNINYEIAEAMNNEQFIAGEPLGDTNKLIPMSAVEEVSANADTQIVVYVDRVVARVDIFVDKDEVARAQNVEFNSSTTISVSGLYYKSSLFEPKVIPTPTYANLVNVGGVKLSQATSLNLEKVDRSSAERLLSFYVAERTYNTNVSNSSENRIAIDIDKITVDGVVKSLKKSTIILGDNVQPQLEQINRNYVYRIYATYKGEEQALDVSGEYVIEDWVVEQLDGDIEGVMLAVTNRVVMDWVRLGSTFSVNDVAFGSNRSVEIYVPSSYDQATGKHTFKRCNFVAHAGVEYDLRELSIYGVPDEENFLRSVSWLKRAVVLFDSAQTGHFEFTYFLDNAPNYMDIVPLQITSANVRKEISIIYDNGYVPGDLLQANDIADCWGDAPNGIAFAKRGPALHPIKHEEVLKYDDDGLYTGDVTMTAAEADKYCKDELGPLWYAPNKAQLADIQRHVLELGISYRFTNTPDAFYWSSEVAEGDNYWSINFGKGLVEPAAVSTPSSSQNFVRCITNL